MDGTGEMSESLWNLENRDHNLWTHENHTQKLLQREGQ
jgi:hypothetical protein